ncbi:MULTISPECIES: MFS transporter [Acinetobacter]|uniref:MFS transporter n=1 Tax=Acinetobacter TaxID=469 RepID=UPI0008F4A380|nr:MULTISPECIES: MFS transporter [Acinetobacter]MDT0198691.1 MFS transporter [Acinetobacter sp. RG5]MDT0230055.1 MFS transporter [Acinetobacter sp. RRD8]OIJ36151.1 MFS transporter [Acinetobacter sp. LCT-H3]
MLEVLKNTTYRHLFLAQVIALIGTGLITIALALQAYDIAKGEAAQVLGIALAIKMIAYIGVAPIASAFAERLPRKKVLVGLDIIRALTALCLPFVTQIWQIYILIFILQSASAAFTPTFQAMIPDVLPDEKDYTNALSLSRLAYDLENIISPMLAGFLLGFISYHNLFLGTVIGFIGSALFVVSAKLPVAKVPEFKGVYYRIKQGTKIYFNTPRLKALLALNLAIASASAVVIVNTVVLVQSTFKLNEHATTWAFGLFGLGSMLSAFILPNILDKFNDRAVMLSGTAVLVVGLFCGFFINSYNGLLALWFALGIGYSVSQTPTGRLIRKSASSENRTSLFAAQFAFSHACWLIAYPLVGWLSTNFGTLFTFVPMAIIALVAMSIAFIIWPKQDESVIVHSHDDLPADHEHLLSHNHDGKHSHDYVIDEYHQRWPK